ncbi:AAA-type ATPase [Candidatus Syntrophocurvum alkaliphilum]|uniref:HTH-type transcriptional regulatory protein TyrR n=1 Tax=Candidatus Syntrophocurvum alkaliphilum TaxID=2293317 RepID=A0A6I6DCP4_9FIRM|nr:sigma-54-dependent Fis family transcriptional regulator [Candidatus Syntrophocurvum alkaliphilum]QGT98662.1 AAA-type ATPase [Candidatus Syntrophocurvum alkaliphilum]
MKIKEIMTTDLIFLDPKMTIKQVAQIFMENHIDGAPVINNEKKLIGVLTKSHIFKLVSEALSFDTLVEDLMIKEVTFSSPEEEIEYLLKYSNVGRLPVVENDEVVGWCTRTDLVKAFFESHNEMVHELQTIMDSTHNLIVAIDEFGTIKTFNKSAQNVLGISAEDIKGKNIKDVFPNSELLKVVATGEAQTLQKIELNNRWFISNRSPVNKDGKIIGAVAVLQDISEVELISQELKSVRELNRELDAIIDSSFDGLYITDGNGQILRLNKAIERISGLNSEDFSRKEDDGLVEDEVVSKSVTDEVLKQKKLVTIIQQTKAGKTALATGSPIFGEDGEIVRVVANVRDITELNELKQKLEQAEEINKHYQNQLKAYKGPKHGYDDIIYSSHKMKEVLNLVSALGEVDSTILITGESGVGKEIIAEALYKTSNRSNGPFIKVNCGAIPDNLLESELFGYESGAFTGAKRGGKIGLFELANNGMIFLDEIGELSLRLQVKLLRVLQNKEIVRVGGNTSIPINMRIITATNRNLEKMVEESTFREDLYYRLNVIPIHIPPLRERKEDIPILVTHFVEEFNNKYNKNKYFSPEALDSLQNYSWPGNVRELENYIERLLVITPGNRITLRDLPSSIGNRVELPFSNVSIDGLPPLKEAVETVEKCLIEQAYKKFRTTRKMAQALQVNASTISRKATKYKINLGSD